jgi:hypothetical protein
MSGIVARGWATVELERAVAELGGSLAAGTGFEPAGSSTALGARCLRGASADGSGVIVLLEPETEGRLAGFLARHGEGWAATWVDAADTDTEGRRLVATDRATPGPFGPERLEHGSPWGPFRLRVAPATIGR